jgi:hypothetical protein
MTKPRSEQGGIHKNGVAYFSPYRQNGSLVVTGSKISTEIISKVQKSI